MGDMALESRVLDEPLLTASQLSVLLGGIPVKTVLQYARDGRLPCVRIGRHVRFVKSDVDLALESQRPLPPSASRHRAGRRAVARWG
jgi:excisionase family DNA binding protein